MSDQQETDSFLSGYRVLDLTDENGLLCGKILGDLGADVIKIEKPGGDPARNIGPFYKDIPHPEKSLYWMFCNTSKRGITLDIEAADGREIFERLAVAVDLVVESFPPGHMQRLGLDYSALSQFNPRLIMTSITPFGQTGPYSSFNASDMVIWGMGGIMFQTGDGDRCPVWMGPHQAEFFGGQHGAVGSMVALVHREMTGEGQHVDVSIQEACMLALMISAEVWDLLKINTPRTGTYAIRPRPPLPPIILTWILPCKDGWVMYPVMGGEAGARLNRPLVEWANSEGMLLELKDFDWAALDILTVPQEEYNRIAEPISRFLTTKTKKELYEVTVQKNIGIAPSFDAKEIVESPQLAARQYWEAVEHPELGASLIYPGPPAKLSQGQWKVRRRAPLIGEHNEEVYEKELGLSKQELAILKSNNVI